MNTIDEVLVAIRRLIRATDMHSKRLSKTAGLTAPQLLILQAVGKSGELTIGEIARAISLSQATVTTIVSRLESRHYLKRTKGSTDRRKVYVGLTAEGKALLGRAPTPLQETFIEQFSAMEEWEQMMVLSSLQRVARMMDAARIDASPVLDIGDLDRGTLAVPERDLADAAAGRGGMNEEAAGGIADY